MRLSIVTVSILFLSACSVSSFDWPPVADEAFLAAPVEVGVNPGVTTIAFGSCVREDKPQPVWRAVLERDPDLFIFLGDNIYADSDDPNVFRKKYALLEQQPGFRALRASVPVIATWDDHDYGQNDIGAEYVSKDAARELMLDFWGASPSSKRRSQPGGIFTQYQFGEMGQRVQVILLDLRWNRSELITVTRDEWDNDRNPSDRGPYNVNPDGSAQMVGDAQWQWLTSVLKEPADVRIIGTSIQALADFTGWESWANFPRDRERLIAMLGAVDDSEVLLISGDTHWSEISRYEAPGIELVEVTSSGLTEEWKRVSPNRHRVGQPFADANFGLIQLDWSAKPVAVQISIVDTLGREQLQTTLSAN
ncbi:MAG: alkaline phosphatase D family protein [Woeseiaceae bacterium]